MSVINHFITQKKEKEKINKEITRNYAISNEVVDVGITLECSREIIIDNLMFDYLIRVDEIENLVRVCSKAKVDYVELIKIVRIDSIVYLEEEFSREATSKMSWDDVANNLIRIHKKLILSKIKKEYPDVYFPILNRAKETTDRIIRGIN